MKKVNVLTSIVVLGLMFSSCSKKNPVVEIQTPKGNILVELYVDQAPVTAKHFCLLKVYKRYCFRFIVKVFYDPLFQNFTST